MFNQKAMKIISMVIAIVLAVIMIGSLFVSIFVYAVDLKGEMSSLKDQLSDMEKEKQQIENEIKSLDVEISDAYKQKAIVDKNISIQIKLIDTTSTLIKKFDDDIRMKTSELNEANKELENQYELFKTRVRVMYEYGQTTYLDILLASGDLTDLLLRAEAVNQIMEYDKNLIADFTEAKNQIVDKKSKLEDDKAEQVKLKRQRIVKKKLLEEDLKKSQGIIDDLKDDKQRAKEEEDKYERIEEQLQKDISDLAKRIARQSKGDYAGGVFTWPAPGYSRITSPYGYRTHPTTGRYKLHSGTDIGAPSGSEVTAANSGTIIRATWSDAYGNYVMIDHGGGMVTLYAHMSKLLVSQGEKVSKGEEVGKVGSTGWSTGPHLHFEVMKNGEYVNPMEYFR